MLIGFICSQFNSLCGSVGHVLTQFHHLLIFWTCLLQLIGRWYCLLLLLRGWFGLWALRFTVADAVVHQNHTQCSSCEHQYCSSYNCDHYSSTGREGVQSPLREREVWLLLKYHSIIKERGYWRLQCFELIRKWIQSCHGRVYGEVQCDWLGLGISFCHMMQL